MPEKLQILEIQYVQQDFPFQKFTQLIPVLSHMTNRSLAQGSVMTFITQQQQQFV
jgi:PhoPQ-activated pathogenicity-related protein